MTNAAIFSAGPMFNDFGFLCGLALALGAVLKGLGFLALMGGGLLAGLLAVAAALGLVALALTLGLALGAVALALGLFLVAVVLGIVLLPLAAPVLLLYVMLRPRRPAVA